MNVNGVGPTGGINAGHLNQRRARTPEEAARQFEEILVRQLVESMTDGMFESNLSGEDGPGWVKSQGEAQQDVFTDVLTQRLVESGVFKISDLLLRQWTKQVPESEQAAPKPGGAVSIEASQPIAIPREDQ
ncbi:MAG: hypothetical protein ACE5G0_20750 [Rhodothermales bacterium]